eukprot:1219145-Prymnesium_polylepis.1
MAAGVGRRSVRRVLGAASIILFYPFYHHQPAETKNTPLYSTRLGHYAAHTLAKPHLKSLK